MVLPFLLEEKFSSDDMVFSLFFFFSCLFKLWTKHLIFPLPFHIFALICIHKKIQQNRIKQQTIGQRKFWIAKIINLNKCGDTTHQLKSDRYVDFIVIWRQFWCEFRWWQFRHLILWIHCPRIWVHRPMGIKAWRTSHHHSKINTFCGDVMVWIAVVLCGFLCYLKNK